ncbi:MAG: hypothetical protein RDV48_12450 [Candidatus Eremiobacteraeota bacterium]|nr:hypothetical protein [Candidatus Eremiobacteraeota bacterium]
MIKDFVQNFGKPIQQGEASFSPMLDVMRGQSLKEVGSHLIKGEYSPLKVIPDVLQGRYSAVAVFRELGEMFHGK